MSRRLREFIRLVITDAELKARFIADPAAVVASYKLELNEQEWAALKEVQKSIQTVSVTNPRGDWIGGPSFTHKILA